MLKRIGFVQIAFGGGGGGGGGGSDSSSGGSPSAANMARPAGTSAQVDRNRQASAMYAAQDASRGGSAVPAHLQSYLPGGSDFDASRSRETTLGRTMGGVSDAIGNVAQSSVNAVRSSANAVSSLNPLGRTAPTQVSVPGFAPSAIAPTSSPRPAPVGQGGGGIMSTASTYLPGGINTANPASFVNRTAAGISLPSFGSGVSTERVPNAFAGGSDGPSDGEVLAQQQQQDRLADLSAATAGAAPSAEAPEELAPEPFAPISNVPPPPVQPLGQPSFMPAMYQLPPLSQFQQPGMAPPAPPPPFMSSFPQPQMQPPMPAPIPQQPPVTFDTVYGAQPMAAGLAALGRLF